MVELVYCNTLKSIQDHSILPTLRTQLVLTSLLELPTCSLSELERKPKSPSSPRKESEVLSLKKEREDCNKMNESNEGVNSLRSSKYCEYLLAVLINILNIYLESCVSRIYDINLKSMFIL